jgi:hypothetical protein
MARPIPAKATANAASKTLNVVVTDEAPQTFTVSYDDVLYGISQAHPAGKW